MAAGLLLRGYIAVEVLILKQTPPGPTYIEVMYALLALAIFALGVYLAVMQALSHGAAGNDARAHALLPDPLIVRSDPVAHLLADVQEALSQIRSKGEPQCTHPSAPSEFAELIF